MEGSIDLLGYGMRTWLGLVALGAVILGALLWRQPVTRPGELTRPPPAGGARWLRVGLLVVAGVLLLGPPLFALLLG